MWWKLLVGVLVLAAIYAPLMVSHARRAKEERLRKEKEQAAANGGEEHADHETH